MLLFLSTVSFISLSLIENALTFYFLSIVFRVFQGIARAAIQICAYSFDTNEMNHDKDRYIGYVEMALGVGDMIGPAIGGVVYNFSGFSGTFGVFGVMIFIGII